MILYNAQEEKIRATKQSQFYRLIEVFNITDQLSIALLEELTGTHIKRGTVYFVNQTPGTNYSIIINKHKLEDNSSSITLIEGTYSIQIYNISKGRKRVLSEKIEVIEGSPLRIEFDPSEKVVAFDKKNTIRANLPGVMIFGTKEQDAENFELQILAFMVPEFSYTRLFTEHIGINITLGVVTSPNIFNDRDSFGIEIKAGPCFRLGRVSLIPMLGYSVLFISPNFGEYSINDLLDKKIPGETYDTASLSQSLLIVLGFEFFFSPTFSIYSESGFSVGYMDKIDNRGIVEYSSALSTGVLFSLGLGISF